MKNEDLIQEYIALNKKIQSNNGTHTSELMEDSKRLLTLMQLMTSRGLVNAKGDVIQNKINYSENIREGLIQGLPSLLFGALLLTPSIMYLNHSGFNLLAIAGLILGGIFLLRGLMNLIMVLISIVGKASERSAS